MRLGILSSHPIQYYSPWFRALAQQVELEVFYAHRPDAAQQGAGFGKGFTWDVDLLSGYRHHFLKNVSPHPGTDDYGGCDTPEIEEIILGKPNEESRRQPNEIGNAISWAKEVSSQRSVVPRRFDAFIVVGWYLKCFRQAVRACRRAGIPVLVRGDSQLRTPRAWPKRLAMEVRQRWLLRQFDGFLSVGQRHKEYLRHFGVPARKIFSVPHFVDNAWFAAKAAEVSDPQSEIGNRKSEIRKKWGIPKDAFCVLFCGKFISKKRPLDLVAAARILTAKIAKNAKDTSKRPIHLLFVGSSELGAELRAGCDVVFDAERPVEKQKFEDSQLSTLNSQLPTASFAGFLNQSELPAAYVAADVLVLPSEGETWGLVVNEAMACGLPAIVSDPVGCAPDLINEGKTGFTFPMGDSMTLAVKLAALRQMKAEGHDFAPALSAKLRSYSVEAAVAGTLHAVKSFVSAPVESRALSG